MLVGRNNQVVEQIDAEELASSGELLGNLQIGYGGLQAARRVVVGNNYRHSAVLKSWRKNFARMHDVGGQAPDRYHFVVHDLVAAVEVKATQLFFFERAHLAEVFIGLGGIAHKHWPATLLGKESAAQLKTSNQLASFANRDVEGLSEFIRIGLAGNCFLAILFEDALRHSHDFFFFGTHTE